MCVFDSSKSLTRIKCIHVVMEYITKTNDAKEGIKLRFTNNVRSTFLLLTFSILFSFNNEDFFSTSVLSLGSPREKYAEDPSLRARQITNYVCNGTSFGFPVMYRYPFLKIALFGLFVTVAIMSTVTCSVRDWIRGTVH